MDDNQILLTLINGDRIPLPNSMSLVLYVQGPEQPARAAGKLSVKRIVTAWIRSMYNWLGDFTPWLGTLDELHKVPSNNTCDELPHFHLLVWRSADTARHAVHRRADLR